MLSLLSTYPLIISEKPLFILNEGMLRLLSDMVISGPSTSTMKSGVMLAMAISIESPQVLPGLGLRAIIASIASLSASYERFICLFILS